MGSIADASGGRLAFGSPAASIATITTDSRDLGERNLFVPLIGDKFDGHSYVEELANSGRLAGFLTMRKELLGAAERTNTPAVLCDDTLRAFGRIAARHRERMEAVVAGITGTNGKTTTKELAWAMVNGSMPCLKNEKNYNNEVGVPFTLLALKADHRAAVIEMGMNHPGEIERLSKIAKPDIALITNAGEGHLEFLESVENVAAAKSEIMLGMSPGSRVILNRDCPRFGFLRGRARDLGMKVRTFGLSPDADLRPDEYRLSMRDFTVRVRGEDYTVPLYGIHNVYNFLAALALALELGVDARSARAALGAFRNIDMRSQVVDRGFILINDAYNSNPMSTRSALESVRLVFPGRRKIAVLADMKELGGAAPGLHREAGRLVHENGFDILCTLGELSKNTALGAREAGMNGSKVAHFEDKPALVEFLKGALTGDDVVLVKGSRSMKMEEVADALVR
jgi:UDP-N-acetylmuramoyl-tripeptide--D-alanyl-D-alanine ligase